MISYSVLCQAIAQWRTRQGLPEWQSFDSGRQLQSLTAENPREPIAVVAEDVLDEVVE